MKITAYLVSTNVPKDALKDDSLIVDYTSLSECGTWVYDIISKYEGAFRVSFDKEEGDSRLFPDDLCLSVYRTPDTPEGMFLISPMTHGGNVYGTLSPIPLGVAIGFTFDDCKFQPVVIDLSIYNGPDGRTNVAELMATYKELAADCILNCKMLGKIYADDQLDDYIDNPIVKYH